MLPCVSNLNPAIKICLCESCSHYSLDYQQVDITHNLLLTNTQLAINIHVANIIYQQVALKKYIDIHVAIIKLATYIYQNLASFLHVANIQPAVKHVTNT